MVSPSAPRTEQGLYWGYSVRLASSFGAVFTQSPYKEGYDITIGTSERGTPVDDLELPNFRYSAKKIISEKKGHCLEIISSLFSKDQH